MNKAQRLEVYGKYDGHCAYCGKAISLKDMQVDHMIPKVMQYYNHGLDKAKLNTVENYMPSCRRCNRYKLSWSLEEFRGYLKTLQERTQDIFICKVAEDYGIIKIEPWNGKFYFERVRENE